jgi:indolepyruvate ferredoxin oxidoreductase
VSRAESALLPGEQALSMAVANGYAKLMAYKDEYEVARMYSDPAWRERLAREFEGDYTIELNLAPPLLARIDPESGRPRKRRFGAWLLRLFPLLAAGKRLRGSALDPFGRSHERRMERALVRHYESLVAQVLPALDARNHAIAVELLDLPRTIRGYGPVKAQSISVAKRREAELLAAFHAATLDVAA